MRKTKLFLFMATLLPFVASAHNFEVDGIYYNIISEADKQAEVTYKGDNSGDYNEYSGSITIPATVTHNGVAYSVTSIGSWAFSNCSSLTAISIPESVTSIGNNAFWICGGLTSITIPESVTSIGGDAFSSCDNLTSIVVAEGNKVYDSRNRCNAIIETSSNTLIQGCSATIIPEGVTSIGKSAFGFCSSLTTITIPASVTCIGEHAFRGCDELTSITIPESVTSIGDYAFRLCDGLTSITIPASVKSIGIEAFAHCSNLTAIVVAEGNKVYDSRGGCYAIIETSSNTLIQGCSATIIPTSVTSIGSSAFRGCDGLTTITIPASVTSIGEHAFSECNSLKSITLPEGVTSIGGYAFCHSRLTSITIPESVTSIGKHAFSECSSLKSITLPEGVTSIGDYTIYGCSSLTAITIPKGVKSIGVHAFTHCSSLTSITCKASTPPTLVVDPGSFYGVDKSIPVYVPEGSLTAYKSAMGWNEFADFLSIGTGIELADIAQGDYYLKNVGSGKFLTGANAWGTRASLGDYGICITLEQLPNGRYTLDTHVANSATDHYLGTWWVDGPLTEWIITESQSGIYALTVNGTEYLGYDGSSTVLAATLTDPTNRNAQWQLVTRDELKSTLSKATIENGIDATFLIRGHSFSRNDNENAAWQGTPAIGGYNSSEGTNYCAEKWNVESFDVYQELTLPNGYYRVTMQGFYRVGSSDNHAFEAVRRHEDGTETLNAIFYANEEETPLMSIAEGALDSPLAYGTWDDTSMGYLPNSMESAAAAFSAGLYEHSIWVYVTDGVLRLGVKKKVGEANDWTIFDNFRLSYYGLVSMTISDMQTSFSQASDNELVDITYTRNFKNTNWQALYVPFEIPVTEEFLKDYEVAYIYDARQYDRDDDGVKDETLIECFKMKNGTLEANYPYLIRAKAAGVKDIVVLNTTLYAAKENSIDCSSVFDTYTFTGTYSRMSSVMLPQNEGYYALSGGEWRPIADGTSLGAFRFYLKIDSRSGAYNNAANARSIRMRFVGDDGDEETTEIDNLESTDNGQQTTVFYDFQGRRVDNPTKGVYIVNGKKVLVR